MLFIDKFIIPGTTSCYFIPGFINQDYSEALRRRVDSCPTPKWTNLAERRTQLWGCTSLGKLMVQEPLPQWLSSLAQKIATEIGDDIVLFNQVLVNEYHPSQGILPHTGT
jgi:alkylated DNA repair protein alkB family protein 6